MKRIIREPADKVYGFYSHTGAYELKNLKAGESVDEATVERFGIPKEFLEIPKKRKKRKKKKRKNTKI